MRYQCLSTLLLLIPFSAGAVSDEEIAKVEIKVTPVAENVYMLEGWGGNIAVSAGEDGVFLVDDQMAPLTEKIKAAISKISDKEVRFLINTHWHFDHVGGNENFSKEGVAVIAHENVRQRLSIDQVNKFSGNVTPAVSKAALPLVTFTKDIKFYLNDDEIEVFHVEHAHTDGDAVIYFKAADVIHLGDIYFEGLYPYIDYSAGGSIAGIVAAGERLLSLMTDKTKVIPGHGPLSTKQSFQAYIDMLKDIETSMQQYIGEGKTLDQILALKPTKKHDAKWGGGFVSPEGFVKALYKGMTIQ